MPKKAKLRFNFGALNKFILFPAVAIVVIAALCSAFIDVVAVRAAKNDEIAAERAAKNDEIVAERSATNAEIVAENAEYIRDGYADLDSHTMVIFTSIADCVEQDFDEEDCELSKEEAQNMRNQRREDRFEYDLYKRRECVKNHRRCNEHFSGYYVPVVEGWQATRDNITRSAARLYSGSKKGTAVRFDGKEFNLKTEDSHYDSNVKKDYLDSNPTAIFTLVADCVKQEFDEVDCESSKENAQNMRNQREDTFEYFELLP